MKLLQVGDHQKAACEKCKAFVNATFELRDVDLSDGSRTVENLLVGVCNNCNDIIVLPHQETHLVKATIDKGLANDL